MLIRRQIVISLILVSASLVASYALFGQINNKLWSAPKIQAADTSNAFIWGVNGHPNLPEAYPVYADSNISLEEQLELVKNVGATWYRVNWHEKYDDGRYSQMYDRSNQKGIRLLPALFPDINDSTADDQVYQSSLDYGRSISQRFKGKISHYELSNELDNYAILGPQYNGDQPQHYDPIKISRALSILKGLSDGIHQGDPAAKTIVNSAGWLHYGFFDLLISNNFNFDVIGWHWYSNMGDITDVSSQHINVAQKLTTYGKDIWVTESNIHNGTLDKTEQEQADYITQTARQFSQLPGFKAYFVYELLDFADIEPRNPAESHYGLITVAKNSQNHWEINDYKLAYYYYISIISPSKLLPIVKRVDKTTAQSGNELQYTITYVNTAPTNLLRIKVSDSLSNGVSYIPNSTSDNGSYDEAARKLTWTIPALAPGDKETVYFKVKTR